MTGDNVEVTQELMNNASFAMSFMTLVLALLKVTTDSNCHDCVSDSQISADLAAA